MSKKMLINMIDAEESRIAIVDDGLLEDLYVESAGREQVKGNIYKGVVVSIAKSLQACFVDYGGNRAGFLSIDEIDPKFFRGNGSKPAVGDRPPIQDVIRLKQELLVQVVKEEIGSKGASLTTYVSLPGRYLVLMPGSDEVGISRKIEDDTHRKRLKEIIKSFNIPEGIGLIARTAGIDKSKADLVKDFNYLRRLWSAIEEATAHCKAPALIYQERDIVTRAIRDHFTADIAEIIVDNKEVFERALEFMKTFMPRQLRILQLYEDKKPLLSHFKVEDQIETIYQHQVRLPSGGAIVIDPTEALVSIDVNSSKSTQERTAEETALRTNLEAAEEIARQLRLRDLGGIIVIDFIDMKESKHKRSLERVLKNSLKKDKARIHMGKVSKLGLIELSRQRLKPAIMDRNYLLCPQCNGVGMVKSTEAKALILLRKLQTAAADGNLYMVRASLPIDVYTYLLNKKRDELARIEREANVRFDFSLKTGFDEQVFNPDALELFTRVPEESAMPRAAAVRDSHILAKMRSDEVTGRDRAFSEEGLPEGADIPGAEFGGGEEHVHAEGAPPPAEQQTSQPGGEKRDRRREREERRLRWQERRRLEREQRMQRRQERAMHQTQPRPPSEGTPAAEGQQPAAEPAAGADRPPEASGAPQPAQQYQQGEQRPAGEGRRRRRRRRGRGGRGRSTDRFDQGGAPQEPYRGEGAPQANSPAQPDEWPDEASSDDEETWSNAPEAEQSGDAGDEPYPMDDDYAGQPAPAGGGVDEADRSDEFAGPDEPPYDDESGEAPDATPPEPGQGQPAPSQPQPGPRGGRPRFRRSPRGPRPGQPGAPAQPAASGDQPRFRRRRRGGRGRGGAHGGQGVPPQGAGA